MCLLMSSMKFFEFVRANLFILGSDVEANKRFQYKKLKLYKHNKDSIKKAILFAIENYDKDRFLVDEKITQYSYSNRIKVIEKRLKLLN